MLAREVRLEYGGRSAISVNQFIICTVQLGWAVVEVKLFDTRRVCCGGKVESLDNEIRGQLSFPSFACIFLVVPEKSSSASEASVFPSTFVFSIVFVSCSSPFIFGGH